MKEWVKIHPSPPSSFEAAPASLEIAKSWRWRASRTMAGDNDIIGCGSGT
eukprot:CAMPEP_0172305942 /NCGR_PEP_ID=MMETSP1058-20130122/7137_1 /TAXON_ID=83371 /ORGANISM="Detonula confervacea, Strain CCMP 353" /LENGTH=49 /DNA_ID=CAMNT_0013017695 /DNA_START=16 /DNA_END=165 /DNA_ORIENTATION=+